MLTFILSADNLPFIVALGVMLGMGVLEVLGTMFGFCFSSLLDDFLPDIDFGVEVDADFELEGGAEAVSDLDGDVASSGIARLLGWLRFGKVPFMIFLILFLTSFGIAGLVIQSVALNVFGSTLPALGAAAPALLCTLPVVRLASGLFAQLIPDDDSSAVSQSSFVGSVATLTRGSAQKGHPAEAKLRDSYGQTHYLMVEPLSEEETLHEGEAVQLIEDRGAVFTAVRAAPEN